MSYLIRSWNVFHGRTYPPGRRAYLEEAVSLATRDRPDIVCLQEVPVWGVKQLEDWSGMAVVGHTTMRSGIGPVGMPHGLTRWLTDLHHRLLRSLFSGQANAMLIGPRLRVVAHRRLIVNDRRFRAEHGRRIRLGWVARAVWAFHRRVAQVVRVADPNGRTVLVFNLHLSHVGDDGRAADVEFRRVSEAAKALASPGEPVVLAGDLNVTLAQSETMRTLVEVGFSGSGPGIDHVLVGGVDVSPLRVWPEEERRVEGRLLSDHAPVELRAAF